MQRRNFIKNTLFATGVLSVASFDSWASITSDRKVSKITSDSVLKKSIMWGSVGMEGTILEKCKAIKTAGFEGIEPNSHMDRNEILEAMQATGLIASSVCNSKHWNLLLSSPDREIRQQGMEAMIVAMEDAKAYGTDAVLLVPGRVDENVSYDECWNRATACIKEMLPAAQELQVKICIENVWNNFILSPLEACTFVDQFNSPYVGFYFDCGNILVYGWPEQWIKILGDRIGRIHIKEYSKQIGDKQGRSAGFGVPLTEGDVRWKEVMEEIRNSYQGGWLTTEQGNSKTPDELKDLNSRLDKIMAL